MDVRERKARLRAERRAARDALTPAERTAAGRALRDAVLDLPEAQMAGTVAAYYPAGTEPDTRGLVYALWKRGSYVLLPVLLADQDLDWASFEGPESLVPGPHGLAEPSEPRRGTAAVSRAGLVLVPALAVDRSGRRLGKGGGSYDRALARVAPSIPVIALLYDGEFPGNGGVPGPEVPAEPHDRPVTGVATPGGGVTWLRGT